jgi:hypothetical protein
MTIADIKGDPKSFETDSLGIIAPTKNATHDATHDAMCSKILEFCKDPKTIQEIGTFIGISERKNIRRYLHILMEWGLLEMTIPEKPKSKLQKYVTTKNQEPAKQALLLHFLKRCAFMGSPLFQMKDQLKTIGFQCSPTSVFILKTLKTTVWLLGFVANCSFLSTFGTPLAYHPDQGNRTFTGTYILASAATFSVGEMISSMPSEGIVFSPCPGLLGNPGYKR